MKKNHFAFIGLVVTVVIIFGYLFVHSQNNNDNNSNLTNNDYIYAEVMIRWNGFGKWMTTELDLGTSINIIDNERDKLQNKVNSFKNAVDFMNYLNDEGWEYLDKETTYLQNTSWCVYTFRKAK